MTAFPTAIKQFSPRQDRIDIVEADDVNDLDAEVSAIQTALGRNPHVSTLFTTATSVAERLTLSDAAVAVLRSYFDSNGTIDSGQVRGLGATVTGLQADINSRATSSALSSAVSSLQTTISNSVTSEANTRASADTNLQNQINNLSGSSSSSSGSLQTQINNEVTARQNADTGLQGQINALSNRLIVVEVANRRADVSVIRTSVAAYNSSASYQDLKFDSQTSSFSDFATTLYDPATGRFFCQEQSPAIMAMSCTISWTGSGGSSGAGIRGLRLITAGGSVLTEFVRNPAADTTADKLSINWIGRLTAASSYFVKVQVLQNSGGPLNILANTVGTPTRADWTRQSG